MGSASPDRCPVDPPLRLACPMSDYAQYEVWCSDPCADMHIEHVCGVTEVVDGSTTTTLADLIKWADDHAATCASTPATPRSPSQPQPVR